MGIFSRKPEPTAEEREAYVNEVYQYGRFLVELDFEASGVWSTYGGHSAEIEALSKRYEERFGTKARESAWNEAVRRGVHQPLG